MAMYWKQGMSTSPRITAFNGEKHGLKMVCRLEDSDPVNRHKPSVEVLFNSLLDMQAPHVTALMLTGMGKTVPWQ